MFESLEDVYKGTKHRNTRKREKAMSLLFFFFNLCKKRLSRLGDRERNISVAMASVCEWVFPNWVYR